MQIDIQRAAKATIYPGTMILLVGQSTPDHPHRRRLKASAAIPPNHSMSGRIPLKAFSCIQLGESFAAAPTRRSW